jgi:1-aminocyclopropane-1-carboxylate deaminase
LFIKRDDLLHPHISGNKYRKLKYNLAEAKARGLKTLLTFGGAYSNHIAAVAAAGKEAGFLTIGIIRGEELKGEISKNPTLSFAASCGMSLEFVSRETYRDKTSEQFINSLTKVFGPFYMLPEGGTNAFAVKGCEEILEQDDSVFDYICCAVGTGGTISGIINSAQPHQKVLGFPALQGSFLKNEVSQLAAGGNWDLIQGYEFGGYGKIDSNLIAFVNNFREMHKIPLDPVYTGKMLFGVMDMISKGFFPEESKILAIHTGGLQGIAGMNLKLKSKNLPLINL